MDKERAYRDEMDSYIREVDARLDYLEAHARANEAKQEMEEVTHLRERREELQRRLSDANKRAGDGWERLRRDLESDWQTFRATVDDVQRRYSAWDAARERRFNARIDEANALVDKWSARAGETSAVLRVRIMKATEDLQQKARDARSAYEAWRDHRSDERLQKKLDDAEQQLDNAYDNVERTRREIERGSADGSH